MMFVKALLAFLALPGMVAFAVPAGLLWVTGHTRLAHPLALPLSAIGLAGLLWCVANFHTAGKGTLAPWAPPRFLVSSGPYRYSRNPMYLSIALLLLGWALAFTSIVLLAYTMLVIAAFHIRVVRGEEPWLARTHGEAWTRYASRVPRWLW